MSEMIPLKYKWVLSFGDVTAKTWPLPLTELETIEYIEQLFAIYHKFPRPSMLDRGEQASYHGSSILFFRENYKYEWDDPVYSNGYQIELAFSQQKPGRAFVIPNDDFDRGFPLLVFAVCGASFDEFKNIVGVVVRNRNDRRIVGLWMVDSTKEQGDAAAQRALRIFFPKGLKGSQSRSNSGLTVESFPERRERLSRLQSKKGSGGSGGRKQQ